MSTRAGPVPSRVALLTACSAVLLAAGARPALAGTPAWLSDVRSAVAARARAPLDDGALDAALAEVARAGAARLPRLRLSERSRLGLDGALELTVDGRVGLPIVAPDVSADERLVGLRLRRTERQLAAARRAEAHDTLAEVVALVATQRRIAALEGLRRALESGPPEGARAAVDARLLAAQLGGQQREAQRLRHELMTALDVPIPAPPGTSHGGGRAGPPPPFPDPLGFTAGDADARTCLASADATVLARLAVAEQAAAEQLRTARAATRIDLEIGGALQLGSASPDASYAARVAVSVRLPPWSPASGSASLAAGAAGLEQQATVTWPNPTPAPPPLPPRLDPLADAERNVLGGLARLRGQEADLLRRRGILIAALGEVAPATPDGAYLLATLELQLADTDQTIGLTRLDAALLCGALPP